ncbi:tetratricopeptide repeat protein [Aidingimonas halophila]|nr:tetratricopeptide repeat protein [Aidingimonas halophila]GHC19067.1 hypothetical protein GCM10008094_06230 [Aidingimonas halophila]
MWILLAVVLMTSVVEPVPADDDEDARAAAEEIEQRQRQYDPRHAHEWGNRRLAAYGGNPDFDYALAMAALAADRPSHAQAALTRVLDVDPSHDRARLELARAYFQLGEYDSARAQFQRVLNDDPPSRVRDNIERFLTAIASRQREQEAHVEGYVGIQTGHDDNLNSATGDEFFLPVLPEIPLAVEDIDDEFLTLEGGASYRRPVTQHSGFFAGVDLNDRRYHHHDEYDQRQVRLRAGGRFDTEWGRIRLPLEWRQLQLGGDSYRRYSGFGAELSHEWQPGRKLHLFGRVGAIDYPDLASRDVNSASLGGGIEQWLPGPGLRLSAGVYAGTEEPRGDGADHYGRDYQGVRLGADWRATDSHTFSAQVVHQRASHDDEEPLFADSRRDRLTQASLDWWWQLDDGWRLGSGVSHLVNESSIALYDYDRTRVQARVRYVWE